MPDRTLLVADDDPGLRESLERTLTREGYRVLLASDGRAALERLQDGAIDLIVTDLKMPGLTGLELLRAAKALAPDVDVILLTAFGTIEEAVNAMKDGAYDFITKPFRGEQLLKVVGKALERRSLIEQNRALQKQLEDLQSKGSMIGGTRTLRVDVRVVTATNQDLGRMVKDKRFREDLYYRLNVITITVPPLREKREDIRLLAQHFLRVYAAKNNRRLDGFTDDAIR